MYRKILVPLDGSALAEEILGLVQTLALCANSEISLLRVTPVPTFMPTRPEPSYGQRTMSHLDPLSRVGPFPSAAGPSAAVQVQHAVEEAERYLETVESVLKAAGFHTRVITHPAPVADAILDTADALPADLIAMTTHGRGGLRRFLLGSVATHVLQNAHVPVLLRRANAAPRVAAAPVKRILVALDGSPHAAEILPHVAAMAKCTHASVKLLRVVERTLDETIGQDADLLIGSLSTLPIGGNRPRPDAETDMTDKLPIAHRQDEAQSYLDHIALSSAGWGVPIATIVQAGDPAEAIIDLSRSTESDLIVMATHGLGGVRRFLLGSVADRVVRHADVPVMLVRPAGL